MKTFLLYEKNDSNYKNVLINEKELIQDLNLNVIFEVMSQGDSFLYDTAKSVVLNSLTGIDTIMYRQDILKDCLKHRSLAYDLYKTTTSALKEADFYRDYNKASYARIVPMYERVQKSLGLLEILIDELESIKDKCYYYSTISESKGLTDFSRRQAALLTKEFFEKVRWHIFDLKSLSKSGKLIIGSSIGHGMKGSAHVLRKITDFSLLSQTAIKSRIFGNTIQLDNISISTSAREIENGGLVHILRVINHFTDNIMNFFEELRYEAGFYLGCINMYEALYGLSAVCFPVPEEVGKDSLAFEGLYDISMALSQGKRLVSNDLKADGRNLFIITGANQGGKSTFLRSYGIAQILMQCGMFVPAVYFRANLCKSIFTHFTREEDASMNSGKLDEELSRMNRIIDNITPGSLLLMNESFATTTEREGSRIANDIITALYEQGVKVLYVTHLYEYANMAYNSGLTKAVFLRAVRDDKGERSYRIEPGEPLLTSFGEDLYKSIIG